MYINNIAPTDSPINCYKPPLLFCQSSAGKTREEENEGSTEKQVLTQIDAGKALKTHH